MSFLNIVTNQLTRYFSWFFGFCIELISRLLGINLLGKKCDSSIYPDDVWLQIFLRCDRTTIENVQQSSYRFHSIINEKFWVAKCEYDNICIPSDEWMSISKPLHFEDGFTSGDSPEYRFDFKKLWLKNPLNRNLGYPMEADSTLEDLQDRYGLQYVHGGDGLRVGPSDPRVREDVKTYFLTSNDWCYRYYEVDLLEAGLDADFIDHIRPKIVVRELYGYWTTVGGLYRFRVHLLKSGEDFNRDGDSLPRFKNFERRFLPFEESHIQWRHAEHVFEDYPAGIRRIGILSSGRDGSFTNGHSGCTFTNTEVFVTMPTEAIWRRKNDIVEPEKSKSVPWGTPLNIHRPVPRRISPTQKQLAIHKSSSLDTLLTFFTNIARSPAANYLYSLFHCCIDDFSELIKKPILTEKASTTIDEGEPIREIYPDVFWLEIFLRCDAKTIENAQQTCHKFHSMFDERFWVSKCEYDNVCIPSLEWRRMYKPLEMAEKEGLEQYHFNIKNFWLKQLLNRNLGYQMEKDSTLEGLQARYRLKYVHGGRGLQVRASNPQPHEFDVNSYFMTSNAWCSRYYEFDLIEAGFDADFLDHVRPKIVVRELYGYWIAHGSSYRFRVHLLKESEEFSEEGSMQGRQKLFDRTMKPFEDRSSPWIKVEHVFEDYPAGIRRIGILSSGKDTAGWAGHHGSTFTHTEIFVTMPLKANWRRKDDVVDPETSNTSS